MPLSKRSSSKPPRKQLAERKKKPGLTKGGGSPSRSAGRAIRKTKKGIF